MTKLEELTAMMVNEIEQFQTAVDKLEKIQKVKMELDLEKLRELLTEHQDSMKIVAAQNERWVELSEKTLKKASFFYKRGINIILLSLVLNLITVIGLIITSK